MSSDGSREAVLDPRAVLDGWRASGADRADPLRFHLIDALARRAAAYDGPVRERLDGRLADLIQAYESALTNAGAAEDLPGPPPAPERGPLAGLVAYLDNPGAPGQPQAADAQADRVKQMVGFMRKQQERYGDTLALTTEKPSKADVDVSFFKVPPKKK